ncbi:MAG: hypothetical protein IPM69_00495 [Ignavibacteria bacterium]|nr:hypothetical protein [Ignavibacteria bacterium]
MRFFLIICIPVVFLFFTSCSFLQYYKEHEFKNPFFTTPTSQDTLSVLFVQYSDIPESNKFIDTLYTLCYTKSAITTIRSEVISSNLIKNKILVMPKNIAKPAILELIRPAVPTRYLLTMSIEEWKESELGGRNESNRDGRLRLQFGLFDMVELKHLYSVHSTMVIAMPDKNDGPISLGAKGFNETAIELVHDTYTRELVKLFPEKVEE